jgi:hypothetical protein
MDWKAGAKSFAGQRKGSVPWWDHPWHYLTQHPFHYLAQHGLNLVIGVGAFATAAGVVTGGLVAYAYGRRASVSISAVAHTRPTRVLLAARPVVKGTGIFALRFHRERGAVVQATEVYVDPAGVLHDARVWIASSVFGQQQVDSGEELATTVLFSLPLPHDSVVGWRVSVGIRAPTRRAFPKASAAWADRVFVPRPDSRSVDS